MLLMSKGMSPKEANKNHHRHSYVHERLPEDNESTKCGSREGAASLNKDEVNCPACRPELLFPERSK